MSTTAREIIEAALKLPREERAAIAQELLVSVEGEDEGAVADWCQIIRRRVDDVLEGRARGPECRSALAEIRDRIRTGE